MAQLRSSALRIFACRIGFYLDESEAGGMQVLRENAVQKMQPHCIAMVRKSRKRSGGSGSVMLGMFFESLTEGAPRRRPCCSFRSDYCGTATDSSQSLCDANENSRTREPKSAIPHPRLLIVFSPAKEDEVNAENMGHLNHVSYPRLFCVF